MGLRQDPLDFHLFSQLRATYFGMQLHKNMLCALIAAWLNIPRY